MQSFELDFTVMLIVSSSLSVLSFRDPLVCVWYADEEDEFCYACGGLNVSPLAGSGARLTFISARRLPRPPPEAAGRAVLRRALRTCSAVAGRRALQFGLPLTCVPLRPFACGEPK